MSKLLDWLFPTPPAVPAPPAVATRTVDVTEADIWSIGEPHGGNELPSVTELENAYRDSSIVYACIQEICQMAATAEVQASMAVATLLEHPNALDDWESFITKVIATELCTGKLFILKSPPGGRTVQELYVLKTSCVYVEPGPFGEPFRRIDYDDSLNHYADIDPDDLIMDVGASLSQNVLWGSSGLTSPVAACWPEVKLDVQRTRSMRETLHRMPYLVGIVESDIETNVEQRRAFVDSVRATIGPGVIFLPKGMHVQMPTLGADWTASQLATHCESRISAALGVPAIMAGLEVGLSHSTYANYGEARLSLRQETVEPLLVSLGRMLSRGLGEEVTLELPEETVTQQATAGSPADEQTGQQGAPNGDGTAMRGGDGSGHFGHAGRPGEVGGSLPGGGMSAGDMGTHEGGSTRAISAELAKDPAWHAEASSRSEATYFHSEGNARIRVAAHSLGERGGVEIGPWVAVPGGSRGEGDIVNGQWTEKAQTDYVVATTYTNADTRYQKSLGSRVEITRHSTVQEAVAEAKVRAKDLWEHSVFRT